MLSLGRCAQGDEPSYCDYLKQKNKEKELAHETEQRAIYSAIQATIQYDQRTV